MHAQTLAFYDLLDGLRAAHPDVAWESCASGGGRIDLGVLERVQRVWTSDMTDAVARQQIQRWTTQLVAPEYVGAHISAPDLAHHRPDAPLDFRAATALFGAFGIEWDLTEASDDELDPLADWVARFKRFRPLLHSGRVVRPESADPAVLLHGVVAADRGRGAGGPRAARRVRAQPRRPGPGARPRRRTRLRARVGGPGRPERETSMSAPLPETGPTGGRAGERRRARRRGGSGCRGCGRRR